MATKDPMTTLNPAFSDSSLGHIRKGMGSQDLASAGFCGPAVSINGAMYKRIPVKKLTGEEIFKNSGDKKFSVLEFWQYGFSNLNSNVLRGALAEFIVENALKDKSLIAVRNPWGDYDLITAINKKVEVKCCSYIQDWDQKELSKIVWSGLKAKWLYWSSAVSGESIPTKSAGYKSDIYILALLKHQDPSTLDILDMNQWRFYVLSRDKLTNAAKNGNSVSLNRLEKLKIKPVSFQELPKIITPLII